MTINKENTPVIWFLIARVLIAALLSLLTSHARAELEPSTLRIASAANFFPTLKILSEHYQTNSEISLNISSGSSGRLYSQILQGAPFDIFFSADSLRPQLLESAGFTVANSRKTYAIGQLILWHPQLQSGRNPSVDTTLGQSEVKSLTNILDRQMLSDSFRFLALANPLHAPYGLAAQEVLTATGHWQNLHNQKQLVLAGNVIQAQQFIASGNAQLGFIALAQLTSNLTSNRSDSGHNLDRTKTNFTVVPANLYTPVQQQAVVLKNHSNPAQALEFLHWILNNSRARDIIQSNGYKVPTLSAQAQSRS